MKRVNKTMITMIIENYDNIIITMIILANMKISLWPQEWFAVCMFQQRGLVAHRVKLSVDGEETRSVLTLENVLVQEITVIQLAHAVLHHTTPTMW